MNFGRSNHSSEAVNITTDEQARQDTERSALVRIALIVFAIISFPFKLLYKLAIEGVLLPILRFLSMMIRCGGKEKKNRPTMAQD